jgi:ribonuclease P protein component
MKETFRPHERIKKKKDFLFIYKQGKRYRGKYFIFIYLPNNLSSSRMAVVVGKKMGNAVKRNKIKRLMRALFRQNKALLEASIDLIILPQKEVHGAPWLELQKDYAAALKSIAQKNRA